MVESEANSRDENRTAGTQAGSTGLSLVPERLPVELDDTSFTSLACVLDYLDKRECASQLSCSTELDEQ